MVFTTIVLSRHHRIGHTIPGKLEHLFPHCKAHALTKLVYTILDHLLRVLRFDRLLLHVATTRVVPVRHVPGLVFAHLVRGAKCRSRRRCCNERAERCLPGPGHVRTIPALLRLLRVLRCHSDLPTVDHLSILHSLRF